MEESEVFATKMKILILYATHGGVTKTCAEMLAQQLRVRYEVDVFHVLEESPAPSEYDVVVLGSNVRFGRIHKGIKQYIKQFGDTLSQMPSAFYLCCGYPRNFPDYIETQVSKYLSCSLGSYCFGGELKPQKVTGFDRLIVWLLRNSIRTQDFEESDADHHDLPEIIPEHITLLEKEIRRIS